MVATNNTVLSVHKIIITIDTFDTFKKIHGTVLLANIHFVLHALKCLDQFLTNHLRHIFTYSSINHIFLFMKYHSWVFYTIKTIIFKVLLYINSIPKSWYFNSFERNSKYYFCFRKFIIFFSGPVLKLKINSKYYFDTLLKLNAYLKIQCFYLVEFSRFII